MEKEKKKKGKKKKQEKDRTLAGKGHKSATKKGPNIIKKATRMENTAVSGIHKRPFRSKTSRKKT